MFESIVSIESFQSIEPVYLIVGFILALIICRCIYKYYFNTTNQNSNQNPNQNPNSDPKTLSEFSEDSVVEYESSTPINVDWKDTEYGFGYTGSTPKKYLPTLITLYGQPSLIDATSGGHAVWNSEKLENTPFEKIEIRDEQIPHKNPSHHCDFLYSWYRIIIPNELIAGLKKIPANLTYDPSNKLICVRCNDMRANVVCLWVIKQYANKKLTLDEAGNMIGPMTAEIMEDDPTGVKADELFSEL